MKISIKTAIFATAAMFASCSSSVTNVYDYYLKNVVEVHKSGEMSSSKSKLLLREHESVNKSQIELIAYKKDTAKYLVLGSHKVAKAFYIHDSLYHFDVTDLYNKVRGDDFIRQLGDLSVFFTHIPEASAVSFLDAVTEIRTKYAALKPVKGAVEYIDFALTADVIVSFEKTEPAQKPETCVVWVGKRKHYLETAKLIKALNDLKAFN